MESVKFDKLLILDIDETLVYASERQLDRRPNFRVSEYFIYKRPGLDAFIDRCLDYFTVAIWTASSSDYAGAIIARIFPYPSQLAFIFTSERCNYRIDPLDGDRKILKPLKKVRRKGFSLNKTIVVDDTPETFCQNYGNAILVQKYLGKDTDNELELLFGFLKRIGHADNIRTIEKRDWKNRLIQ
ncbi:MAG: HAD family hydrolase [Cyanobacteria bacterium SID2]|nr:HAD family hydrolase [Cyanobacteria bacterium SID2]MBP0004568.1 HAD family hydrolase [Cyanobacteria bacterium SBC]